MPKVTQAQEWLWKPAMIEYNYCCGGCGSPIDLEYDHIIPRCKGGSDNVANIQILCHHCNQHKGKTLFPKVTPENAGEHDRKHSCKPKGIRVRCTRFQKIHQGLIP